MIEGEPRSFPTNSVAKEDLLYCRSDLELQIESLADSDIERIANQVGRLSKKHIGWRWGLCSPATYTPRRRMIVMMLSPLLPCSAIFSESVSITCRRFL